MFDWSFCKYRSRHSAGQTWVKYSRVCRDVLSHLKGNATNFTHEDQFTPHEKYCSVCENSCVLSLLSLEELSKVWGLKDVCGLGGSRETDF